LSAKDLPGGQTQVLNIRRIRRINSDPVESDQDSAPESISDTEDRPRWNGDLDNSIDSEGDSTVDAESDIEQDYSIEDPECPEERDVSARPNVPRLIWPTRKSMREAEEVLMTDNAIQMRRNKGVKKYMDSMRQCFTSFFMYFY